MPPEFFIYAFLIDLVLGDPAFLPHPVRAIGRMASKAETLRGMFPENAVGERLAGIMATGSVVGFAFFVTVVAIIFSYRFLGIWGGGIVSVYLAYTTISARGLADAAMAVKRPLEAGDIHAARGALSMIVGRDTAGLDVKDIARGAVETVAENFSDGVVAPLFYMALGGVFIAVAGHFSDGAAAKYYNAALGGVPLAMAYKAVNTLDSMVGYRTEKYRDFGWAAARLDDLANFIPARLAAVIMVATSALLRSVYPGRFSAERAWTVFLRDGGNHPSPNSGRPEAAAAGALGVVLGGKNSYFGKPSVKPYIGEQFREMDPDVITDCVRLMYASSAVAVAACAALAWI